MPSSRPASLKARPRGLLEALRAPRRIPLLMGVVNATPDSFYPGSRTPSAQDAIARGLRLREEGADLLDIGGQSTRPGSEPVAQQEELSRVIPVVEALARRTSAPVSIDTDKAGVARRAREAGALILNDVSALRNDSDMLKQALLFEAVILMHRGGQSPRTMQDKPFYGDVVKEVRYFLRERKEAFVRAGGEGERILIDPGIGFGKDLGHNLSLLKHIREFSDVAPVVLSVSRKSFLGRLSPDGGPAERLAGSLAAACWAALQGVRVLRVHDVEETRRALRLIEAVSGAD